MKHQIKRFNQFINEYYSYPEGFGKEEGGEMSACCGSIIDDQGCCTECGEECETYEPRSRSAKDFDTMRNHFGYDDSHFANIEEGRRKPKAEDMEMEDDDMPMPKKPAAKSPAKKPMPFMPKKSKTEDMEDDDMPMAKKPFAKGPAKKPMPFMPKKPAGKAPMIQPKKPGAKGVDLIKGAAMANAMKKDMPGKRGGFM